MLTKTPHLFDDATRVTAGDSCWQGRTSEDYWAFVGPFGGATAATMLRALLDHPQRAGDPLSLTVNFCAPVARRTVRSRRSPDQGQPVDPALVGRDDAGWRRGCDLCHRGIRRAPSVMVAPAGRISRRHRLSSRRCLMPRFRYPGSSNMISALSRASRKSARRLRPGRPARTPNYGSATASRERSTRCR